MKATIGCIGQGFVGKSYADDFENRGFAVVRYALEEPYRANKDAVRACDIVFIAVPTPTTPEGFDDHIVRDAVALVGEGKIAVIKSTVLPGTTESIQEQYPDRIVLHSPEFLTARNAAFEAAHPEKNIVGIPVEIERHRAAAAQVLAVLPEALHTGICTAREAELLKYGRNGMLYTQVIFMNLLHNLTMAMEAQWKPLRDAYAVDPWMGRRHVDPVDKGGRGAGGPCFIKDFKALLDFYKAHVDDPTGIAVLEAIEKKNLELLRASGKDKALVEGVYGADNAA